MMRIPTLALAGITCVAAFVAVITATTAEDRNASTTTSPPISQNTRAVPVASVGDQAQSAPYEVHIRQPKGPPTITLAGVDPQGRTGEVACSTCHSVRKANLENKTAATLDEFHQGLKFAHGDLTCYSCHHPENADALRLANGALVEYRNVMTLCSQCHSAQATAFAHGAHGGMNGFWDLSRGPQTKNNCIDCHDPHTPSYPKMIVGFKPRDRFLQAEEAPHDEHE